MAVTKAAAAAIILVTAGGTAGVPVEDMNFDQLVSFVMYENEEAYKDTTAYFCSFIKLSDKDDYCKSAMNYLDPKLCKIEITKELRVTYDRPDGKSKGRDFIKSRDVFLLAGVDAEKIGEPEIDREKKTSWQRFEAELNVRWKEDQQYSVLLDEKGGYKSCLANGEEKMISEDECAKLGTKPPVATKQMSLLYNSSNYRRAIAALRRFRREFCTSNGEPL